MSCGGPIYSNCLLCSITGANLTLEGLLDYCSSFGVSGDDATNGACVMSYLTNCQIVDDPLSSSSQQYSSTSSECPSGNNDFNFENVMRGFSDYNDVFVLMFACFLLVKLIWMAK